MSWLRLLFAKDEKIARLEFERDYLTVQLNDCITALEASEARLFREIDSNRNREDALVAAAVTSATGQEPFAPRRELLETNERMVETGEQDGDIDHELEAQIEQRAQEFAVEAAKNGVEYDEMTMTLLKEKIRLNPAEYLEN